MLLWLGSCIGRGVVVGRREKKKKGGEYEDARLRGLSLGRDGKIGFFLEMDSLSVFIAFYLLSLLAIAVAALGEYVFVCGYWLWQKVKGKKKKEGGKHGFCLFSKPH